MMMMGMENDERWERGVGTGWYKRLTKKIIDEGNCEDEEDEDDEQTTKIQAAILYPQLDSEQRKNDEEEEQEPSSKPIQTLPLPCLFQKKKKKEQEGKKKLIEFRELGWLDSDQHLLHKIHVCLFLISGIPDES